MISGNQFSQTEQTRKLFEVMSIANGSFCPLHCKKIHVSTVVYSTRNCMLVRGHITPLPLPSPERILRLQFLYPSNLDPVNQSLNLPKKSPSTVKTYLIALPASPFRTLSWARNIRQKSTRPHFMLGCIPYLANTRGSTSDASRIRIGVDGLCFFIVGYARFRNVLCR
jgi:hypothetical protein